MTEQIANRGGGYGLVNLLYQASYFKREVADRSRRFGPVTMLKKNGSKGYENGYKIQPIETEWYANNGSQLAEAAVAKWMDEGVLTSALERICFLLGNSPWY